MRKSRPMIDVLVTRVGIVLVGLSWGRVDELQAWSTPGHASITVQTSAPSAPHGTYFEDHDVAPHVVPRRCVELSGPTPAVGTWESFIAGSITDVEFAALNPGIGVLYRGPNNTSPEWVNDRLLCMKYCGVLVCARANVVDGYRTITPLSSVWTTYHEVWASDQGQPITLLIPRNEGLRWVYLERNPPVALHQGVIYNFDPCDLNLNGVRDINDFATFLTTYEAGNDWNQDGQVNVGDFIDFLNEWAH